MKIAELQKNKAGVEALARASFKDGALTMKVLRTVKTFNLAVDDIGQMHKAGQDAVSKAEADQKQAVADEWNNKIIEAQELDAEWKPAHKFNGELLGSAGLTALELLALENLGLLE